MVSKCIPHHDSRFEATIKQQEPDSIEPRHYGWTLWKAEIPVKEGQVWWTSPYILLIYY